MGAYQQEGPRDGEYLISEAEGARARTAGILAAGNNLVSGAVLGRIEVGACTAVAAGGNTGNGAMGAITVGAGAMAGDYHLRVIAAASNGGQYQLSNPDGVMVGIGNVGAAFSGGGLSFTLAAGGADFAVSDGFTLTVAKGSGKYTALDVSAGNGAQRAAGILWRSTDATAADQHIVVHKRDCEVDLDLLSWPAGITDGQKARAIEQLLESGIVARPE